MIYKVLFIIHEVSYSPATKSRYLFEVRHGMGQQYFEKPKLEL